ncbi:homocysteine-responsive endoplasmic reticulum-resident ubiquitin-like domain member 1 protein [Betta splendens]|uniref:Homocysteine-responsive endoplasmic reticulum-resident ubiquitin-like domain member 1 protein n=1 Tax=Betta splendens TaxID=158456 RepID=A0A6P7MTH0_BETSP|nr:homocysteine-responsive endoplasmic reticulum-resident ubiquitin-like domain member 1 protein [Betta splendens]
MDVGDTITLLIKTPNQAQEDQTVEGVHPSWTVMDLKTRLSAVYPTKPTVSEQRLIYGGKLLPDHLHISDIFRQTDSLPTLHLVCPSRNPFCSSAGAENKTKETEQSHPSTADVVQTPSTPELRQRRQSSSSSTPAAPAQILAPPPGTPVWPAGVVPGAPQVTQPAFPRFSLYSPQQLLWLQHVYARQYYMQYHAALAAAGTILSASTSTSGQYHPVPAHQMPVPGPLANQNPIDNLPVNQNPAQDGVFMNPGEANQNMRMNAQGGPIMADEEDVERDWLDWLYSTARFGVLLMIVYHYSNLSRFLLVMSTLLIMYLHSAGWFPFRRQMQVQGPNHLLPPQDQHDQQNADRNPNPADTDGQEDEPAVAANGSDVPGPMTAVLVPPHRVSIMFTAWVFLKSFLSSLIPELPQGMAN